MDAPEPKDFIVIDVENAISGAIAELELPKHTPMRTLVPAVAEQLHMQPRGVWMRNKTQGFSYGEMDTLASTGTAEKDFCQLSGRATGG
jgi:hypothetical protein